MSKKSVQLYSTVVLKGKNWQERYTIVRPNEVNIFENKISSHSPLGKSLFGCQVNQVLKVKTLDGDKKYKILVID